MNRVLERPHTAKYLAFAVLPVALYLTGLYYKAAMGPYYLAINYDPEYVYLFNALNIIDGAAITHTDHPGTTLQVLMALLIKVRHLFGLQSEAGLSASVLMDPEGYLGFVNSALLLMNSAALFFLGAIAYRYTKSLLIALVLQASPFMSETVLRYGLPRVSPEPLLLFSCMLMSAALLVFIQRNGERDIKTVFLLSIIAGFGMATKVTFFPVLLVPLFIVPGIRRKASYLFGVVVSFVFFTLPIVSQYPRMFGWLWKWAPHKDRYGAAAGGVVATEEIMPNLKAILVEQEGFIFIIAAGIVVLLFRLFLPRLRDEKPSGLCFRLLAGLVACDLVGVAMALKHFEQRYLLPTLALSGLAAALVVLIANDLLGAYKKSVRLSVSFLVLAALAATGVSASDNLLSLSRRRDAGVVVNRAVKEKYPDYAKVYFYSSSSPAFALHYGNRYARYRYADELRSTYGGEGYVYNIFGKGTMNRIFTRDATGLRKIASDNHNRVLFQGLRYLYLNNIYPKGICLQDVYGGGGETILIYNAESSGRPPYVWTGRHGDGWTGKSARLKVYCFTSGEITVSIPKHSNIISNVLPLEVHIKGDNNRAVSLSLDKDNIERRLDASQFINGVSGEITIEVSRTWRPADIGMGGDMRDLGVKVGYNPSPDTSAAVEWWKDY